jgi:hypothetical protein
MNAQATVHPLHPPHFPTQFVKKPANALQFKNRKKLPLHRLPFVDAVPGKVGLSFWAVPKTGGYSGGNETGKALARIYLKHIREHVPDGMLQLMVLDMFDQRFERGRNDSPEMLALQGQVVGFFCELERWVLAAARQLGTRLDALDDEQLLKAANNGLGFDEEAHTASLRNENDGGR